MVDKVATITTVFVVAIMIMYENIAKIKVVKTNKQNLRIITTVMTRPMMQSQSV